MGVFVNVSNHPSSQWSEAQLAAARQFGKITDIRFPAIDPTDSPEKIQRLAESTGKFLRALGKPVVMVQGEFTFTYHLVRYLQSVGIRAVVSCSRRVSDEYVDEKGETVKISTFRFEGFRDYYSFEKNA